MDDLVAFLAARLDEDEAAAKAAASVAGPDWTWKTEVPEGRGEPTDYVTSMTGALLLDTMGGIESEAPFVARHDPARVLREVAAKRAIVRRCEQQAGKEFDNAMEEDRTWVLWPVLFDLAAVWCDHPDYRQEWKP